MGCTVSKDYIYHKPVNAEASISGPFINPTINSFEEIEKYYADKTLIGEILNALEKYKTCDCLGYRRKITETQLESKYTFFTYGEVQEMSINLVKNLRLNNLVFHDKVDGDDFFLVGIFSKNCVEWTVSDIACQLDSITSVTFYATLGDEAFAHIANESRVSTIFVSIDNINKFCTIKEKYGLNQIKNIVIFDLLESASTRQCELIANVGVNIFSFKDMVKQCREEIQLNISKSDTVMTICYTSGTTGMPKGVMLTQRNTVAQLVNMRDVGVQWDSSSVHFSFLPLAHIFERVICFLVVCNGAKLGYISGDLKTYLMQDLAIIKPTVLFVVPRVVSNIRQKIFDTFANMPDGLAKRIALQAVKVKKENLLNKGIISHSFYDRVVFNKVRQKFGGRLQAMISCSAPLVKEIADDVKILLNIPIVEGYGMTESTGACLGTQSIDYSNISVGGVTTVCQVKLVDVPEMNYTSKTTINGELAPSGEVCTKGPCVFKGYFKKNEETRKVIDKDGWIHTGDVGQIMPHNLGIKIIDRVKELFKLSQGEYIAPSKLESLYSRSKYVSQLMIYGKPTKTYIIGILVPNQEHVISFLKSVNKWSDTARIEDFFKDEDLVKEIKSSLEDIARETNLNNLERVQSLLLTSTEFTIDNGCLTPTLKFVRKKIEEMYKCEIEELYNQQ